MPKIIFCVSCVSQRNAEVRERVKTYRYLVMPDKRIMNTENVEDLLGEAAPIGKILDGEDGKAVMAWNKQSPLNLWCSSSDYCEFWTMDQGLANLMEGTARFLASHFV